LERAATSDRPLPPAVSAATRPRAASLSCQVHATMATAVRKCPPAPPPAPRAKPLAGILAVCEAIYRFLASLKLAVISLVSLAAVLSYATFFESWYGA